MAKAEKVDSGKMHTITLTRNERNSIGKYLPERGSILTMLVAKQVVDKCKLSDAEVKELNLRLDVKEGPDGKKISTVVGDAAALNKTKALVFTESEFGLITSTVDKMDADGKIELSDLDIVSKVRESKAEIK